MRLLHAVVLSSGIAVSAAAFAQVAPVAERVAAQNKLFEDEFQESLRQSPQRATAYGDYRYNDQLDDVSLATIARQNQHRKAYLAKLDAISTTGFPEQDLLSHQLAVRSLKLALENYELKDYEMPVDQMGGPHSSLADLPNAVPLDSVKQYEDYIARLHQVPRVFQQTIEAMKAGENDHLMPVRFLLEKVPGQCEGVILDEIKRIEVEMTAVAKRAGYPDLVSFRASLVGNPKYIPTSEEQILDNFRKAIAQMEPKLPQLFTLLPKSPVTVEAIPAFQAAMATHYQTGTLDGKRPGRVSVAVSDFQHRDTIKDEAVAYHEGIPGHHMQLSIQQQLTGLPGFRLHGGNSAYVEGWALYAEQLGKEVGFYQDPVSDYGRLSSELFRAVRLVVDTGIHDLGWSRDQVVEFMRNSHAVDEPTIQSETDRYIAWPAQALSYKLGQLKFVELRERAKKELGPKFDIRTFHDEMLDGGALPLDVLDARTDRWIAAQKAAH
ncbi:DUF885 family protein [Terriglobus sp. YAF25]|uniref:DUF885 domain-containing protein n=1 Tax=Terriglobus sp. YAF25 TaxID=3233080 RepID=UPI003F97390E